MRRSSVVLLFGLGVLICATGMRCDSAYPLQVGFQNSLPGTTLEVERQDVAEEVDVLRLRYRNANYDLVGKDQCGVFSFTVRGVEVIPTQQLCGADYLIVGACFEGSSREPCVERETIVELDIPIDEDLLR